MIRTTITPDSDTVSITVPEDYIGKAVEIIAFSKEEGLYEAKKVKPSFTVLHTSVANFKFNRDEANER